MSPAGQTQIRSKMTCNNPWNTDNCYDGLLRGVNASRTSEVTTLSDLVEYRSGTVECTGTGVVPTWSSTEMALSHRATIVSDVVEYRAGILSSTEVVPG